MASVITKRRLPTISITFLHFLHKNGANNRKPQNRNDVFVVFRGYYSYFELFYPKIKKNITVCKFDPTLFVRFSFISCRIPFRVSFSSAFLLLS